MSKSHRRRGRRKTQHIRLHQSSLDSNKNNNQIKENTIGKQEALSVLQILSKKLKTETFSSSVFLRKTESMQIRSFIYQSFFTQDAAYKQNFSTMVIFGQPGLGKTMLVNQILEEMKLDQETFLKDLLNIDQQKSKSVQKHDKSIFKREIIQIKVNAMRTPNCTNFLLQLYKEFLSSTNTKKKISQKNISYILQQLKKFIVQSSKNYYFVVFIDELEELYYKDLCKFDSVIEFLNINKKGFVKICISNQLNLAREQGFQKVFVFFQFLIFKPYKEKEIQEILKLKLQKCLKKCQVDVSYLFNDNLLRFLAKKNLKSNFSDFRNLLKLVREVVEKKNKMIKVIKSKDIKYSLLQFNLSDFQKILTFQDEYVKFQNIFESLSQQYQYFLFSIYLLSQDKKRNYYYIKDINEKYKEVTSNVDLANQLDQNQLHEYLENYGFIKLYSFTKKKKNSEYMIQLNIDFDIFYKVLKISNRFKEYFNNQNIIIYQILY